MLLKPNLRICMNMPFCTQKRLLFFIWTQLTQIKTCDLAGLGLMHHAQVRGFHYRRGTAVQVGHFSWNAKGPIGVFAVHAETYGAIAVFYLWFDGNVGWLRAEVKPFRVAEFCSFLLCCVCEKHRGGENTFYTWSPNILIQTRKNLKKPFARMVKLRFFASWSCTHSLKMHGNDAISICKPIGSDLEEKHTNCFGPFETWWMSFSWTCQRTLRLYILCLDLSFDQRQVQFFLIKMILIPLCGYFH